MSKRTSKKQADSYQSTFHKKSRYEEYAMLRMDYFDQNKSDLPQEYIREEKRKIKKLPKLIANILVICSLVILVVVASTLCSVFAGNSSGSYVDHGKENVHNFQSLSLRPTSINKVIVLPSGGAKAQAEYLYNTALDALTDAPYLTAYNSGLLYMKMGSSENFLDIDSVILKSQEEYFKIEYRLKNSVPILDSFIGAAIAKTTDVVTTMRYYASATSNDMIFQKVKNNNLDENGVPYASWNATIAINTPTVNHLPKIAFNSKQGGKFSFTNHTITHNTISDAEVTYNLKEGYYDVSLTLDHTNPETVQNSLVDITSGTGDDKAYYTQVKVDFSVWDTGAMRTFSMVEKWAANVVISLNFQLDTNWQCSYNKADCNLAQYKDCKEMKQSLGI